MTRSQIAGWISFLISVGVVSAQDRANLQAMRALEGTFQDAIQKAESSVVCILVARGDAQKVNLANPDVVPESYGSGVVVGVQDGKGLILTNYHVVRESSRLYARLPSSKGSYAKILAGDPRSDLAMLILDERWPVRPIKLGDGDHVRKGQLVLSIANPFAAGFQDGSPSASWGIISNIRRRAPGKPVGREQDRAKLTLHHFGTLLQTDARLNLGCSGGALIDLKGELIGLTTAQAALAGSESAGGFAVPMNARMKQIVQRLLEGREVEYGFLGVSFLSPNLKSDGAGVSVRVIRGSPVDQALSSRGRDYIVIQAVDGMPVHDQDDLLYAVGSSLAGSKAKVEIQGVPEPRIVTLAKYYVPGSFIATKRPPFVHGLRVDYTSVLYQKAQWADEIPRGVYVSEIEPGSAAERAKLKDAIIMQVNGQAVTTPSEFYRVVAQKPGTLALRLHRGENVELK